MCNMIFTQQSSGDADAGKKDKNKVKILSVSNNYDTQNPLKGRKNTFIPKKQTAKVAQTQTAGMYKFSFAEHHIAPFLYFPK